MRCIDRAYPQDADARQACEGRLWANLFQYALETASYEVHSQAVPGVDCNEPDKCGAQIGY